MIRWNSALTSDAMISVLALSRCFLTRCAMICLAMWRVGLMTERAVACVVAGGDCDRGTSLSKGRCIAQSCATKSKTRAHTHILRAVCVRTERRECVLRIRIALTHLVQPCLHTHCRIKLKQPPCRYRGLHLTFVVSGGDVRCAAGVSVVADIGVGARCANRRTLCRMRSAIRSACSPSTSSRSRHR
eukprot:151156-Rhodomonas_salina.1